MTYDQPSSTAPTYTPLAALHTLRCAALAAAAHAMYIQAIAVLFHLNRAPEALGAAVVRRIAADTLSSDSASPHALARLCFVLGHLALKLLVYSEVC